MGSEANILAIVGRPNVGKSALFNRIVGRRVSIVHEEAGVTRDRVSAVARWRGKRFEVVDTGGIAFMDEEQGGDFFALATRRQAEVAIEMATALILVVDVQSGVTPLDLEIARKLRASGKKIFLAVNKVDNNQRTRGVDEFSELGFEPIYPIAAIHGLGVEALVEAATAGFARADETEEAKPTHLAIVGRPNVGKSSLVNAIIQDERTIVSEVAGTTRDSVDVPFTLEGKSFVLVDTAGLRHKRKIKTSVDQFGLMRAERSIRECDVAVLVLDALAGVTEQDKKVAGQILEAGRACVILVNKWDLAAEEEKKGKQGGKGDAARGKKPKTFREEYLEAIRRTLFFLDWAPVLFVSAKTGLSVRDLFREVALLDREGAHRIETPELNRIFGQALEMYPPPVMKGRRFKVFYAFQQPGVPPTFILFVNGREYLTPHYERFLIDRLRKTWSFTGWPVRFQLRARERRDIFFRTRPSEKSGKTRGSRKFS
jgi:GTP-binding protein